MTPTEIVLSIANGSLSVSRIKRILKAAHGLSLSPAEVAAITSAAGIPTPTRTPSSNPLENDYPDQWSILLEARTYWVRVRRYWGDAEARQLRDAMDSADAGAWRSLWIQLPRYTAPSIYDRVPMAFDRPPSSQPLDLEALYAWDLQKTLYLSAYSQEFVENPEPQAGAQFPILSPEFEEFRKKQFKQDCMAACDRAFPDEKALINYFVKFWQRVEKRGDSYFENLRISFAGSVDQPLSQRPFYSAAEGNFRHFLRNLKGFETKGPWRAVIIVDPWIPLPMPLEGALLKYGWQRVNSLVAFALLGGFE